MIQIHFLVFVPANLFKNHFNEITGWLLVASSLHTVRVHTPCQDGFALLSCWKRFAE